MRNVTLFTKNGCPRCRMTKRFLDEHNINYTEHNINEEPEYVNYLKKSGLQDDAGTRSGRHGGHHWFSSRRFKAVGCLRRPAVFLSPW